MVSLSKQTIWLFAATMLAISGRPAAAIVGGTQSADSGGLRASAVRIETSRGELCSGAVIAPDFVLTAAHCLMHGGAIRVVSLDRRFKPRQHAVAAVLPHPSFVPGTTPRTQPGADLALVRLLRPLPADLRPLRLGETLARGEEVRLAGYGLSSEDRKSTARILREVTLVNVGSYTTANTVKVAVDTHRLGETPGAGACRGDSGGPVLRDSAGARDLVGIVSWSSGPLQSRQRLICGGFTAITPIEDHIDWIAEARARLRSYDREQPDDPPGLPAAGFARWFFGR